MTPQARRRPPASTAARHAYQDFFRAKELGRERRRSRKDYMNAWIAGELDRLDN